MVLPPCRHGALAFLGKVATTGRVRLGYWHFYADASVLTLKPRGLTVLVALGVARSL